MLAFTPRQARGLTRRRTRLVRALPLLLGMFAGCAPHDPHAVAAAADRTYGGGIYSWLADHDPSAIVVGRGVSLEIARRVAPDASVTAASSIASGCSWARAHHALFGVRAALGSADRDRANDCGYAIFRDERTLVIAPR